MSGGGGLKGKFFNVVLHQPVQLYLGLGGFLYAYRSYQTKTTFNSWFGKAEFQRRVANGTL
jgi:hypothetical protein